MSQMLSNNCLFWECSKEVRRSPVLSVYYGTLSKGFIIIVAKHDAWVNIAKQFGCWASEVKKKMDSMLASFRCEKAKGKKIIGIGRVIAVPGCKSMGFRNTRNIALEIPNTFSEVFGEEPTMQKETRMTHNVFARDTMKHKSTKELKYLQPQTAGDPRVTEALDVLTSAIANRQREPNYCDVYGQYVTSRLVEYTEDYNTVASPTFPSVLFSYLHKLCTCCHRQIHVTDVLVLFAGIVGTIRAPANGRNARHPQDSCPTCETPHLPVPKTRKACPKVYRAGTFQVDRVFEDAFVGRIFSGVFSFPWRCIPALIHIFLNLPNSCKTIDALFDIWRYNEICLGLKGFGVRKEA
ncbi:hypothetical protein PR048_017172 [Dryococelus australis]|uniref:Uncharacterized protein n=1 Tax=Dryococelus australis TaxID=614101 RepID=A0ABQ9H8U5_9NEOP|nr:hypothetical protein PR048_017172 [Dryococelus australis]